MDVVYESLFRLGEDRTPETWAQADGIVVLGEEGHVAGAKEAIGDRTWGTVNERVTDLAAQVHPGRQTDYLENIWPAASPLDRFVLASLVTDGRVHVLEQPAEHARAGSVRALYSNETWSSEAVQERLRNALDRAVGDGLEDRRLMVSDLLGLSRRR